MGITNEEAITIIKNEFSEYADTLSVYAEKRKEAFDMAIKALEQQPCEDCISRAKALEILGDEPENWTDTEKEIQELNDYRWFKSILEELPLVTPSYNSIKTELTPSEDCISREAIKEMLSEEWTKYIPMELDINLSFVLEKISELPSVTPQRPKGKWKPLNYKDEMWGYVYKCSNCGHIDYGNDYCPNCGARMESDKE